VTFRSYNVLVLPPTGTEAGMARAEVGPRPVLSLTAESLRR
jgi:hypothetical protein